MTTNESSDSEILKNKEACLISFPKELSTYQKEWFCKFSSIFSKDSETFVEMLKDAGCFDENNWKKNLKHVFYNFLHDESEEYKSIWTVIKQAYKSKKTKFTIFDFVVRRIPTNIESLKYLTSLTISDTEIHGIAQEVFRLQSLEELTIRKCPVYEIPEEIAQCKQIRRLTLSRLRLQKLPDAIAQLPLQKMDISYNFIASCPISILQACSKSLRFLDIQANYFDLFDQQIEFPKLKQLNVSETKTNTVKLDALPNLKSLDCCDLRGEINIVVPDPCHPLREIQISNCMISKENFIVLLNMPILTRLEYNGCRDSLGTDIGVLMEQEQLWSDQHLYKQPKGIIDRSKSKSADRKAILQNFLKSCKSYSS